uniref:(RS)-norcoclaurine 6-O-methyltransferase-like n=1 Tax=Fragaria vesca subsp. vesca TaxID=101020 RepID=UPI0005C96475|nr:PREDICTED: (RS)-norcoclaurine 6-O-methyltransferase-like [Fragaria vesca subsp. vesca]
MRMKNLIVSHLIYDVHRVLPKQGMGDPWLAQADEQDEQECRNVRSRLHFWADAAIIKWVLHDWGDEECICILRNCREAIPKDKGKVIILEAIIEEDELEEDELTHVRLMLDMVMMAHTNTGKERTLKEWGYVLQQAGFSRHTVTPISAVQSVIQAFL